MHARFIKFLKHPTSLDVIINTLGNYLNVFFSLIFILILARALDRIELGVFSVLFGIAYVLANILDFGTSATIYSYLPPLLGGERKDLYRFIKSTIYYQSIFAGIVVVILIFIFPYLDKVFFKTGAPAIDFNLTALSVLLFIWQNFVTNILFAAKKFIHANIYINVANIIKITLLVVMMATSTISLTGVIVVIGIVGPMIFFLLLFLQKKDLIFVLLKSEVRKEEFRFGYTLTYFTATQFYGLGLRMDLFLLSFYGLKAETGDYGLAQKIILSIIATIVSITQVISPGFSNVRTKKEAFIQFRTSFLYLLLPTLLFLGVVVTPEIVFRTIFPNLTELTGIVRALCLAYVISAIGSAPMLFILYTLKKPRYILMSNMLFFIIVTMGSYVSIPKMGVQGPPWAIFAAFVVAIGLQSVIAWKEYEKLPKR